MNIITDGIGPGGNIPEFLTFGLSPGVAVATVVRVGPGRAFDVSTELIPVPQDISLFVEQKALQGIEDQLELLEMEQRQILKQKAETPEMRRNVKAQSDYLGDKILALQTERSIVMEQIQAKNVSHQERMKRVALAADVRRNETIKLARLTNLRKAREKKRAMDAIKRSSG